MHLNCLKCLVDPLLLLNFLLTIPPTLVVSAPIDARIPSPSPSSSSTRQPLILGPLNVHSSPSGPNTRPKTSISFSLGDPYTKTAAQCNAEWETDDNNPLYPTSYVVCTNTNPTEEFAFKFPPDGYQAVGNFKLDVKHRYTDSASGTRKVVTAYGSVSILYNTTPKWICKYTYGVYDCNIPDGKGPIQAPITSIV